MLIELHESATSRDVERVIERVHDAGLRAHVRQHRMQTVVVVAGAQAASVASDLRAEPGVKTVRPIAGSYTLASRDGASPTRIELDDGTVIGGDDVIVVAGPCCIEDEAALAEIALAAAAAGARVLKASVHHAASSPYGFQGPGPGGLRRLAEMRAIAGLPVMSEVHSAGEVEAAVDAVDVIQVGSNNMQSFDLLRELGRQPRPVLVKRGRGSTIEEWLLAAEYVLCQGNPRVMLCEPGVGGFDSVTDRILDVAAVPALRALTHLPIVVDPSEATGRSALVPACARAAIAAGADAVLIDVHPRPPEALAGGRRSLTPADLAALVPTLALVADACGRGLAPGRAPAPTRPAIAATHAGG